MAGPPFARRVDRDLISLSNGLTTSASIKASSKEMVLATFIAILLIRWATKPIGKRTVDQKITSSHILFSEYPIYPKKRIDSLKTYLGLKSLSSRAD
jgi:hypothetical protein